MDAPQESEITILVVDDHAVVREGLRGLLDSQSGLRVVGEANDGRDAVERVRALHPDVVVLDIAMPGLNGIDAATQIRAVAPATRFVLLSAHGHDAYIERVLEFGDVAYVLKRSRMDHLFQAIREAAAGRTYFSPAIRARVRAGLARSAATPEKLLHLTPREREVLQLIVEGSGNKQAARALGISVKTVEKHRQSVMRKLDLHDVTALVRYAVTAGLVECSHPDAQD